jgi:hypothetical protein
LRPDAWTDEPEWIVDSPDSGWWQFGYERAEIGLPRSEKGGSNDTRCGRKPLQQFRAELRELGMCGWRTSSEAQ